MTFNKAIRKVIEEKDKRIESPEKASAAEAGQGSVSNIIKSA